MFFLFIAMAWNSDDFSTEQIEYTLSVCLCLTKDQISPKALVISTRQYYEGSFFFKVEEKHGQKAQNSKMKSQIFSKKFDDDDEEMPTSNWIHSFCF